MSLRIRARPESIRFRRRNAAFAARVLFAAAAEKSLDAQYYIWHGDQVGYLLFEALWQAAERGVRVRLLLDDLNTGGLDPTIAALDAHPNIEVRLYNPLVQRDARVLNFLTDFTRVNRRMHNKSFTVDNQVSVVGGRNIANEYFGAGSGVVFADLDVIAVGAAVREVSKEFDLYWNSPSAYPAASFVGAPGPDGAANLEAKFAATRADPESIAYLEAVRTTSLVRDLLDRQLALEWTHAQVVYDDPAKTLDTTDRTDVLLFPELVRTMGRPEKTLDLVSPYFVPGEEGTAALVALASKGVKVRILTNSLASIRCESRARGLREAPRGSAPGRGPALRDQDDGGAGSASRQGQVRIELVGGLACEDVRRGPQPHLRRLVQLRPALGATQHRDGPRDRQSEVRPGARRAFRHRRAHARVRGPVRAGRPQSGMDRADRFRRDALRHRAGNELVPAPERRRAIDPSDRLAALARRLERLDSCSGFCSSC